VISALIMGSPARRLTNPITRCWDQPHNRYAGTDDGLGTGRKLDTKQLTLMRVPSRISRSRTIMQLVSPRQALGLLTDPSGA
jgi:hypothetical protein